MVLVWNGVPSHRSRRMMEWVASQRDWLSIDPLPGYAPDLNPIEQVWGSVKSQELAQPQSPTPSQRLPKPPKTGWTVSATTLHSASPFSVTLAFAYDPTQPAITRESFKAASQSQRRAPRLHLYSAWTAGRVGAATGGAPRTAGESWEDSCRDGSA